MGYAAFMGVPLRPALPLSGCAWLLCAVCLGAASLPATLDGRALDPLAVTGKAHVLVFVRSDCPISNRYAPELKRIFTEYQHQAVDFWLVYADPAETPQTIAKHLQDYDFGWPALRDPGYTLVKRARATVTPEAAVFKADGGLAYHGRIDDRYVDFGKSRLAADKHDLEAAIAATLAGKPVAEPTTRAIGCYLADLE